MESMTAAEYLEYLKTGKLPGAKKSKYRAVKTNGYDSKHEAERAAELKFMEQAGEIAKVVEQVPFQLAGGVKYIADFVILNKDGTWAVEDAKGFKTKEYRIKKRLFEERYGKEIKEV